MDYLTRHDLIVDKGDKEKVAIIFSNLTAILPINEHLYSGRSIFRIQQLNSILALANRFSTWTPTSNIGDILVTNVNFPSHNFSN